MPPGGGPGSTGVSTFIPTRSGNTERKSGFPSGTCCTSALSKSARRRAKDATAWKSTGSPLALTLLSGQKVLDASETSYREGQEGKRKGWGRGHLCPRSLSTAIAIHISI